MTGNRNADRVFYRDMHTEYIEIERGEGVYLYDKAGKRYLDGASGAAVVCLGHANERLVGVLSAQAKKLAFSHIGTFTSEPLRRFAAELCRLSPKVFTHVYPASGGSEAVESCVKLARQYHYYNGDTWKYKVISRSISYHGATIGALSMTGQHLRKDIFMPMLTTFSPKVYPPYCYRCLYKLPPSECKLECAHSLERAILAEGPEFVSAFIFEPVIGASAPGVAPKKGYFRVAREICKKYNVLMIADEVMSGVGRCGSFLAMQQYETMPDMVALSKGLSGGYSPLGATLVREKIVKTVLDSSSGKFLHGHTFGGNPLSAAVGCEVLNIIQEQELVDKVREDGEYFLGKLDSIMSRYPMVGDVRGRGLLLGIEFVQNRRNRAPFDSKLNVARRVQQACLDNGLYVYPGGGSAPGSAGDHILIAPPYIITRPQIDEFVQILDDSLARVSMELSERLIQEFGDDHETES